MLDNTPDLEIFAIGDIMKGDEILYDYGEIRESVTEELPWMDQL